MPSDQLDIVFSSWVTRIVLVEEPRPWSLSIGRARNSE
jgi:hypothetical protein